MGSAEEVSVFVTKIGEGMTVVSINESLVLVQG